MNLNIKSIKSRLLNGGYIIPAIIACILTGLVAVTLVSFFYERERTDGDIMLQDLAALHKIFKTIDTECKILGFDQQKNSINFLNVEKFAGSEVGPMNLTYPTKWKGPYVTDNPTIHGHEYLIIQTSKGYFITPDVGVTLPNGKVVGEDISLEYDADIDVLSHDPDGLMYDGRPLALQLIVGK